MATTQAFVATTQARSGFGDHSGRTSNIYSRDSVLHSPLQCPWDPAMFFLTMGFRNGFLIHDIITLLFCRAWEAKHWLLSGRVSKKCYFGLVDLVEKHAIC